LVIYEEAVPSFAVDHFKILSFFLRVKALAKKKPALIGRFQLHLLLQWHHTGHNLQVREPSQLKGHTHEMDGLVFGIERSWPGQELMGFESFFKKYKFNYFPVTIPKLRWLSNVCRHEFCQCYLSSY
jgi:hypothetical protein